MGTALEQALPAAAVTTQGPNHHQSLPRLWPKHLGPTHRRSTKTEDPKPGGKRSPPETPCLLESDQGPSVCLSVLRVNDTLGPGAVFRGLPPGCPRGGGIWPLPALPAACRGQALEDTMRQFWTLKQLFLFTCCLSRRCFCNRVFFFPGKKDLRLRGL